MTDILLKTEAICKEFSGVPVLKDYDLEIVRGEVLGIIGENGAGKSTLMKIMGGIYTPTSGKTHLRGAPCRHPRTKRCQKAGHQSDSPRVQPGQRPDRLRQYLSQLGDPTAQRSAGQEEDDLARTRSLLQQIEVNISPNERIDRLQRCREADGRNLQSSGDGCQTADHG